MTLPGNIRVHLSKLIQVKAAIIDFKVMTKNKSSLNLTPVEAAFESMKPGTAPLKSFKIISPWNDLQVYIVIYNLFLSLIGQTSRKP